MSKLLHSQVGEGSLTILPFLKNFKGDMVSAQVSIQIVELCLQDDLGEN